MKLKNQWTAENLIREIMRREPDATKHIQSFMSVVDPVVGIIRYFGKEQDFYSDEPKLTAYRAEITPTQNFSDGGYSESKAEGGRSIQHDMAVVGAIFEGLERYCLSIYLEKNLVYSSYQDLKDSGYLVLDPSMLVSAEKVKSEATADEYRTQVMGWTKGWSLRHEKNIFIPAQCVFLPYKFKKHEPCLRDPLTSGAAAGLTFGGAILRGLMEIVERDATTLIHYRQMPCPKLDLSDADTQLQSLLDSLKRYHLDFKIYDYSLDLPVPIVACKILDSSGIGPSCTVGAKASFNVNEAAKGAILEAGSMRLAIRGVMDEVRQQALTVMEDYSKLETANLRSFLWSQPEMVHNLDYQDQIEDISKKYQDWKGITEERLRSLLSTILEKGHDMIITDVTTSDIESLGVKVAKVIVPGLQHMHLYEQDRCFAKRTLTYGRDEEEPIHVNELNSIPHPFG